MRTKRVQQKNTGARTHVPAWLANPHAVGPCICGMPLLPGQPYLVATGECGMQRWFHGSCWAMIDGEGDEEWDDEE